MEPHGGSQLQESEVAGWIERARLGDARVLDELYVRFADRLLAFLVGLLRNQDDADDAAQDVLIKAHRGLPSFSEKAGLFEPWLFRIAKHHALDVHKKRARSRAADPVSVAVRLDQLDYRDGLTQESAWIDFYELAQLVEDLPKPQKAVLWLRFAQDLTHAEIADRLDMTPAAVRQHQHRALQRLREQLEDEEKPSGTPA